MDSTSKFKQGTNEAKGVLAAVLKVASILIPFGAAYEIGIPQFNLELVKDLAAIILVFTSAVIGFYLFHKR